MSQNIKNEKEIPIVKAPPFYSPLFWPFVNLWEVVKQPSEVRVRHPVSLATLGIVEHSFALVASFRSFLVAYAIVYWLYDEASPYPAWGRAKSLKWEWIWPIVLRNIAGCWIICGFWDWFLYFSSFQHKLKKFKMNPIYPSMKQMRHDAFYSTIATLCASGIEILLCFGWANEYLHIRHKYMSYNIPLYVLMAFGISHMRKPHFYVTHRLMHPWRKPTLEKFGIPDIGKFLYRHIHSLHHKSYNPTAFSGTSMHAVEATVYFSAAIQPVLMGGLHPIISIAWIMSLALDAWTGHDGFQWPGSADYSHYLHHKHFDCNYGTGHIPFDYWFGTFAARKEDISHIWKTTTDIKNVGEEGNQSEVHFHLAGKNNNEMFGHLMQRNHSLAEIFK